MDRNFIDGQTLEAPRLYIIMRKDLYQMNPGKLAAQAAHAGTKFVFDVLDHQLTHNQANPDNNGWSTELSTDMHEWAGDKGFGTKITLEAKLSEMHDTTIAMEEFGLQTGMVKDPTYPYSNWNGDHYTSIEETCMYVFAPCDVPQEALNYLRKFKLHP